MFGIQYSRGARKDYNQLDRLLRTVDPDYPQLSCYQHFHEIMCYILTPRCDPQTKKIIPPCREACLDFVEGCVTHFYSILPEIELLVGKNLSVMSKVDLLKLANCSYLPPANGIIPCFYKPVTCPAPPAVHNGFLLNVTNETARYPLGSVKEYVCQDGQERKGNSTITCLHSGQWSEIQECMYIDQNLISPLLIVVPLLIVPSVIFWQYL